MGFTSFNLPQEKRVVKDTKGRVKKLRVKSRELRA
jgi:hypothetical protein